MYGTNAYAKVTRSVVDMFCNPTLRRKYVTPARTGYIEEGSAYSMVGDQGSGDCYDLERQLGADTFRQLYNMGC
jgi:hypothetical protein